MNPEFWAGRRVFVTGHTGFKGGWLTAWLRHLAAEVTGFALAPPRTPNLFEAADIGSGIRSVIGDIREPESLRSVLEQSGATVVFHLAAQPIVRAAYSDPALTYATNVMGTVNVLDAIRHAGTVRAAVIVSSDKCYENGDAALPFREGDQLGGRDPYSSSKACVELVTASWRASYFTADGAPAVATARAGNVIGGGDWAQDRLVPDLLRAFAAGESARIRHPSATRPWQHVLDPLHGYLLLAERLASGGVPGDAFNFGPDDDAMRPVRWIANALARRWEGPASWSEEDAPDRSEAMALRLNSERARTRLGWVPRLSLEQALDWTVQWHRSWQLARGDAREMTVNQIENYTRGLS